MTSGGIVGTPIALAGTPRLVSGYVIAPGLNLTGANLAGADLSNADLTGANLTSANLTNANLTSAVLKNVNLTRATITGATFSTNDDNKLAGIKSFRLVGQPKALPASGRFRVAEGYFIGPSANLEGAQFTSLAQLGVSLSGTNFTGAFLGGVNFTGATLTNTIFTGANLQAANLSGASMTNAQLYSPSGPAASSARLRCRPTGNSSRGIWLVPARICEAPRSEAPTSPAPTSVVPT